MQKCIFCYVTQPVRFWVFLGCMTASFNFYGFWDCMHLLNPFETNLFMPEYPFSQLFRLLKTLFAVGVERVCKVVTIAHLLHLRQSTMQSTMQIVNSPVLPMCFFWPSLNEFPITTTPTLTCFGSGLMLAMNPKCLSYLPFTAYLPFTDYLVS